MRVLGLKAKYTHKKIELISYLFRVHQKLGLINNLKKNAQ